MISSCTKDSSDEEFFDAPETVIDSTSSEDDTPPTKDVTTQLTVTQPKNRDDKLVTEDRDDLSTKDVSGDKFSLPKPPPRRKKKLASNLISTDGELTDSEGMFSLMDYVCCTDYIFLYFS